MAEIWELICHHTYTGIPGVVLDLSPTGASHGKATNIPDSAFLVDGATASSGAVNIAYAQGAIDILTDALAWRSIVGIRGEVTLLLDTDSPAFLIDSNSFNFFVRSGSLNGWFHSTPNQYAQVNSHWDAVTTPYSVPTGRWLTLGFMHDGLGTMELYADGDLVARHTGTYHPVNPPGPPGVRIGNSLSGGMPAAGRIDEVKIWRRNPRFMMEEFFERPMDDQTADCWRRFTSEVKDALRRHPECQVPLTELMQDAVTGVLHSAANRGLETWKMLQTAAQQYRELWHSGDIDGDAMVSVFVKLFGWLEAVGINPSTDPNVLRITRSDCLRIILAEVKPPDCDRQMIAMYRKIADALGLYDDASRDTHGANP